MCRILQIEPRLTAGGRIQLRPAAADADVLGGLAEFERELTPYQRQEAIQRLAERAGQADFAGSYACRRQPSAGWKPPKSPAASGVNRAARRGGAIQALRKHCAKLIVTCEKCHKHAAESRRILTRLSGDNFPDGTPRSVG